MAQKLTGEAIFLRYAFPVSRYCGEGVSDAGLKELEEMVRAGKGLSIEKLEEHWPNAVASMRQYAKTEDESRIWLPENVRGYWLNGHNKIVGNNRACMVYRGVILEVLPFEKGIYRVRIR